MYCTQEPSALFHALHQVHRKRVLEEQALRGLSDLGSPFLLLLIGRQEETGMPYSQQEAARNMRLSPATVAAALQSMERHGYISRRPDQHDSRRNQVTLTPRGKEAIHLCSESFRRVDQRMLIGFSPEEKTQLDGYLHRMLQNLYNSTEAPPACGPLCDPFF